MDLYPKEEWKREISKEALIAEMQAKLANYPEVNFNFSQPISDNVEEAVSGVKGSIAIKVTGQDLNILDTKADTIYSVMSKIKGVEDLGVFRNLGQPELRIMLLQDKLALYAVDIVDCNAVIEMAIGGKAISQVYENERKFDIRIRYDLPYRYSPKQIGELFVPTLKGDKIPLKEIAEIKNVAGQHLFTEKTILDS